MTVLTLLINQIIGLAVQDNTHWSQQSLDLESDAVQATLRDDYNRFEQSLDAINVSTEQHPIFAYAKQRLLTELLILSTKLRYESVNQAQARRELLFSRYESAVIEQGVSDETLSLWRELLVLLDESIDQQSASLPHVIYHTLQGSLPAIVVAYDYYGHTENEQDIITRNQVEHPAFLRSDSTLELLSV